MPNASFRHFVGGMLHHLAQGAAIRVGSKIFSLDGQNVLPGYMPQPSLRKDAVHAPYKLVGVEEQLRCQNSHSPQCRSASTTAQPHGSAHADVHECFMQTCSSLMPRVSNRSAQSAKAKAVSRRSVRPYGASQQPKAVSDGTQIPWCSFACIAMSLGTGLESVQRL